MWYILFTVVDDHQTCGMECDILDTFPERQESTEYEDDGSKSSKTSMQMKTKCCTSK